MDSYSFDSSDSSISYTRPNPHGLKPAPHGLKPAINSVQKTAPPSKPWRKPVAGPVSPKKPRVYQVDRMNFRQLVQELTGPISGPTDKRSRLHQVGPPHLDLTRSGAIVTKKSTMMSETVPEVSLGLGLSPTSAGWCSFLTLSPTTVSSFGSGSMF